MKNQLSFIGLDKVESMFTMFSNNMGHHSGKAGGGGRRRRSWDKSHEIGPFSFLMRVVLIRHTMKQKCRQSNRDLMSLPEKTERIIKIPFTADERTEYDKIENAARNAYTTLKARERSQLSRHYLQLHSYLLPLRTACSGGKLPDKDPFENDDEDAKKVHQMEPGDDIECSICLDTLEDARATQCKPVPHIFCRECIEGVIGVNDDSSGACPICRENVVAKKLCKAVLPKVEKEEGKAVIGVDCKAVFKSKFTRLLAELKKIKDNEPNAKSLVFSQFTSTVSTCTCTVCVYGSCCCLLTDYLFLTAFPFKSPFSTCSSNGSSRNYQRKDFSSGRFLAACRCLSERRRFASSRTTLLPQSSSSLCVRGL